MLSMQTSFTVSPGLAFAVEMSSFMSTTIRKPGGTLEMDCKGGANRMVRRERANRGMVNLPRPYIVPEENCSTTSTWNSSTFTRITGSPECFVDHAHLGTRQIAQR